jgi:hypothetical protein
MLDYMRTRHARRARGDPHAAASSKTTRRSKLIAALDEFAERVRADQASGHQAA